MSTIPHKQAGVQSHRPNITLALYKNKGFEKVDNINNLIKDLKEENSGKPDIQKNSELLGAIRNVTWYENKKTHQLLAFNPASNAISQPFDMNHLHIGLRKHGQNLTQPIKQGQQDGIQLEATNPASTGNSIQTQSTTILNSGAIFNNPFAPRK